ncbi:MAG: hypothetical protein VW397_03800, partial [Candidatus Margulisiibacteriota bacterium]
RSIALGKSASFSTNDYNNLAQNPATITNAKGISIHGSNYLDIDYSSIIMCNQYKEISIGLQYLGSTITNITRSTAQGNLITEIDGNVPYEFHSFSLAFAKDFNGINIGVGAQIQTLTLDNTYQQKINEFIGIKFQPFKQFNLGMSVQNISSNKTIQNALQKKYPIYALGLSYNISNFTSTHLSFINNENEISPHSTLHYGVEQYINDFLPIRFGLDHNRYTFGAGINLDPFMIDIGWAQSRSSVTDDQVTISISYGFEEINHLYKH